MISTVTIGYEIEVVVKNEVGVLAKIASFLVNHGINIEGILGYAAAAGQEAGLLFITNNNDLAMATLKEHGYENISENEILVVELENRPGTLKNISEILAQNEINIEYIYATTCKSGCPTKVVLSTSDNSEAFKILGK